MKLRHLLSRLILLIFFLCAIRKLADSIDFFNGEIYFETKEEKTALRKWLVKKDAAQFRDYFEKNILAACGRPYGML